MKIRNQKEVDLVREAVKQFGYLIPKTQERCGYTARDLARAIRAELPKRPPKLEKILSALDLEPGLVVNPKVWS